MLMSCGQQNKQETTMDFVDNVKVALADSGHINRLPHVKSRMIPFASPPLRRPTSGSAPTITSRTTMPPCFR